MRTAPPTVPGMLTPNSRPVRPQAGRLRGRRGQPGAAPADDPPALALNPRQLPRELQHQPRESPRRRPAGSTPTRPPRSPPVPPRPMRAARRPPAPTRAWRRSRRDRRPRTVVSRSSGKSPSTRRARSRSPRSRRRRGPRRAGRCLRRRSSPAGPPRRAAPPAPWRQARGRQPPDRSAPGSLGRRPRRPSAAYSGRVARPAPRGPDRPRAPRSRRRSPAPAELLGQRLGARVQVRLEDRDQPLGASSRGLERSPHLGRVVGVVVVVRAPRARPSAPSAWRPRGSR